VSWFLPKILLNTGERKRPYGRANINTDS